MLIYFQLSILGARTRLANITLQQLRKNNEAYTTVRFLTNVFVCYAHQGCIYLKNTVNCIITI